MQMCAGGKLLTSEKMFLGGKILFRQVQKTACPGTRSGCRRKGETMLFSCAGGRRAGSAPGLFRRSAGTRGWFSRHCQLPCWVLGVLMRPSAPRCSQSARGMMAVSDTLARQAQIMLSVNWSGVQRRYWQARWMSAGLAFSRQASVVTLSWVPVYTTLFWG